MSGRENRSTRIKHTIVSLCPTQIPHGLNRARIRAAEIGSRRLTARTAARLKEKHETCSTREGTMRYCRCLFNCSDVFGHRPESEQATLNTQTKNHKMHCAISLSALWTSDCKKNHGVFWDVTPCGSCKNRRFGGT
jgi:hypothetical protein